MISIHHQITEAIAQMPVNEVIVAADFKHLGLSTAVRKSLSRLAANGSLHRLGHGLYSQPQTDPILGLVHPAVAEVALSFAAKTGMKILPSPAAALNQIGLSTQVPMRYKFLCNGTARKIKLGGISIEFKQANSKKFKLRGAISTLVLLGLEACDLPSLSKQDRKKVKDLLDCEDRTVLLRDLQHSPSRISDFIHAQYLRPA
jgi:hypothetical protein